MSQTLSMAPDSLKTLNCCGLCGRQSPAPVLSALFVPTVYFLQSFKTKWVEETFE